MAAPVGAGGGGSRRVASSCDACAAAAARTAFRREMPTPRPIASARMSATAATSVHSRPPPKPTVRRLRQAYYVKQAHLSFLANKDVRRQSSALTSQSDATLESLEVACQDNTKELDTATGTGRGALFICSATDAHALLAQARNTCRVKAVRT